MITKDNNLKVMKVFFENPEGKFHLRELERITGLSMPGVKRIAEKLEKEGVLESKREAMLRNFFASRNEKFLFLKRSYNILSIFNSGLLDFLRKEYEEPEAIVLFGSYSRGEDISSGDIDIAIVTRKHIKLDIRNFESKLKRRIELHEISLKKSEKPFLNTLANGIVIYGYLEVIQ